MSGELEKYPILNIFNPNTPHIKRSFTIILMRKHKYITTKMIAWEFNKHFHVNLTNKSFTKTIAELRSEGMLRDYRTQLYISTLFEKEVKKKR